MYRRRLELGFKDTDGKNFKLTLDEPREDLEDEEVKNAMDLIVSKDVFRNKNRALSQVDHAQIVITEIEKIHL